MVEAFRAAGGRGQSARSQAQADAGDPESPSQSPDEEQLWVFCHLAEELVKDLA